MKKYTSKALLISSLGVLLISGKTFAHTSVADTTTAGTASYNAFTISHGCGDNTQSGLKGGDQYPVIGQAFIAPYGSGDSVIWREDGDRPVGPGLNNVPYTGTIPVSGNFSMAVDSVAGASGPFPVVREIVDTAGVVHGLVYSGGGLEPKLRAKVPFYVKPPAITDNCVEAIKVRMAVINYCDIGKNASNDTDKGPYAGAKDMFNNQIPITYAKDVNLGIQRNVFANTPKYKPLPGGNGKDNRADWWFYGTNSAKYIDPDMLEDVTDGQFWTTLTVNNTAANIALCTGTKHTLTVEPSGTDMDTYLSGPNTWPFTKGDSDL